MSLGQKEKCVSGNLTNKNRVVRTAFKKMLFLTFLRFFHAMLTSALEEHGRVFHFQTVQQQRRPPPPPQHLFECRQSVLF